MTLANPILLWSLLGLAVPIAIHLLSRKEGQVIRLGSIRHLQETSTQQFKGIKLNEILLLALRCALIFIFCLLLSGLKCSGISNQKWVVIEAGFENHVLVKSVADSFKNDGYEQHLLCEGFPTTANVSVDPLDYWTLVDQLREMNLATAVVLSSNKLENFKGKRIALPPNIRWIAVPSQKVDFPIEALRLNSDSVCVRTGHSSESQTFFTSEKTKSPSALASAFLPDSIRISIVTDDLFQYDRKILRASLSVIQKTFPVNMKVSESTFTSYSPKNIDWCFWLSNSRSPESDSVSKIVMRPSSSSNLIERVSPRVWSFTKRLDEEVALDQSLTLQLTELIVPSKKQKAIAQLNDVRTMPDSLAWSTTKQLTSASAVSTDANRLLIICLVALLLVERIFAYRRNQ